MADRLGASGADRLGGKVALVTGAASGLGRAIAETFSRHGAAVMLADINQDAGRDAARAIGGAARFVALDVTSEASWQAAIDAVTGAFGRLDVLVNNAGIAIMGDVERTPLDDWRRVHAVNVDGPFLGCKYGIPLLRRSGGGSIINMSSIAGLIGVHNLAAYCSSKGAVRLLTKSVALRCARRKDNIRCNSIHPVYAETPMVQEMLDGAPDPAAMRTALTDLVPLGRLAQPQDIADMAVFLASDDSRLVTGAELVVDGGLTAA
jgi:NAD(P)-dependent dehydrogenase (short-subunit alcohol dehydrogenase family)